MAPILARYGPFFLYSFSIVLSVGVVAGLGMTAWEVRDRPRPGWKDAALLMMAAGIVGGRVVYVLAHLEYFRLHPAESWRVWTGGLSYHGALWGALLALWLWARYRPDVSFRAYADLFAPAGLLLGACGWLACLLEGCAYGRESVPGLLAADLPDAFGVYAIRYQTQLWGILSSVALLFLLWRVRSRLRRGQVFALALFLFSLAQVVIGLFRGDPAPLFGPLRLDVAANLVTALAALVLMVRS